MTTEAQFLKAYNPTDYPVVLVTVDTVLLTFHEGQLNVLLVKRAEHPQKGKWALPGGFLDQKKDKGLERAAIRSVKEKTGVAPGYLEQIETIGSKKRDPRGWSVAVVYSALMPHVDVGEHNDRVDEVAWWPVNDVDDLNLAFDHNLAIDKALERHKQKALYSFVPVYALHQPLTITELRKVHEALIGHDIQRKSFIRRVESSEMFVDTFEFRTERGRPAALYKARPEIADYRFIRNIETGDGK